MVIDKKLTQDVKGNVRKANYEKILKAAVCIFATKGFQGTTVQEIAHQAELPKANVLYYFKSKEGIYEAVLTHILSVWNSSFDKATVNDDPAQVLSSYISEKLELSRTNPEASKIFAMEMINGAPLLSSDIKSGMVSWFNSRTEVIQQWIKTGKMQPVDPQMLMFHIWATTQHYADFSSQISILRNGKALTKKGYQDVTEYLTRTILAGCGLSIPSEGMEKT